jgi:hypothetical protein
VWGWLEKLRWLRMPVVVVVVVVGGVVVVVVVLVLVVAEDASGGGGAQGRRRGGELKREWGAPRRASARSVGSLIARLSSSVRAAAEQVELQQARVSPA